MTGEKKTGEQKVTGGKKKEGKKGGKKEGKKEGKKRGPMGVLLAARHAGDLVKRHFVLRHTEIVLRGLPRKKKWKKNEK